MSNLSRNSADGSIHYVCMDWRHVSELLAAGNQVYDDLLNLCVWTKNNGGQGSLYRSRHELVFVFKRCKRPHRNNVMQAWLDCSARGELILDSFLGSGSTLLAAERVGRICYGMELAPQFVDVAVRRWQRHTGERAVLEASGKAFGMLPLVAGSLQ